AWGVLSRVVLSGGESPLQGEGRDGSTQPAQDTSAGHCWTGPPEANLPAGHSQQSACQQATPLSGSLSVPGRRVVAGLLAGPEQRGSQWGRQRDGGGVRSQSARQYRGIGRAPASATLSGHTGPSLLHTEGKRPGQTTRDARTRRPAGATRLCEAVDGHLCTGLSRLQVRLSPWTRGVGGGQRPHLRPARRDVWLCGRGRRQRLL